MLERNESFVKQLHQFVGTSKGNKYDKAAIIYRMIKGADEPTLAFEYFCDKACYIDSSDENEVKAHFTASQIQILKDEFDDLLDGILNKLLSKHFDKSTFYSELWKNIESDILFEEEDKKIYALYRIWCDGRIPYFQIDEGIKMSDDEFQVTLKETEELLREITFIMSCKFKQKTERSSILLRVLNSCKDDKEKAVVLAYIISTAEIKILESLGIRRE